ncbi:hypothetical protein Ddye_014942 [Dipteronia dyeriana]|uniref:Uncharacterized protein n=1 Tax=Dipteronia dyeriana TaxID=168575 RepID=A0AAD9U4N6_9ROSI|nr:hypothetical protein Ddye_014942 [Dipteronia dyeriana]
MENINVFGWEIPEQDFQALCSISDQKKKISTLLDLFLEAADGSQNLNLHGKQFFEFPFLGNIFKKILIDEVKRKDVDIWGCKDRGKVKDGGADVLTVRSKLKLVVPTL